MEEVARSEGFVDKVFELWLFTFDEFNVVCTDFKHEFETFCFNVEDSNVISD